MESVGKDVGCCCNGRARGHRGETKPRHAAGGQKKDIGVTVGIVKFDIAPAGTAVKKQTIPGIETAVAAVLDLNRLFDSAMIELAVLRRKAAQRDPGGLQGGAGHLIDPFIDQSYFRQGRKSRRLRRLDDGAQQGGFRGREPDLQTGILQEAECSPLRIVLHRMEGDRQDTPAAGFTEGAVPARLRNQAAAVTHGVDTVDQVPALRIDDRGGTERQLHRFRAEE